MNCINHKLKVKNDIFKSSDQSIFYEVFCNFFVIKVFNIYMKISKNLSNKHYQENKERLQRKSQEIYQNLSKKEKEKK